MQSKYVVCVITVFILKSLFNLKKIFKIIIFNISKKKTQNFWLLVSQIKLKTNDSVHKTIILLF